jgi:transposase-like protein
MLIIAEQFMQSLVRKYGKHPVSTDGGTWYPQACKFLKLKHHIHLPYEKNIIERTIQYIKDRTESFDAFVNITVSRFLALSVYLYAALGTMQGNVFITLL